MYILVSPSVVANIMSDAFVVSAQKKLKERTVSDRMTSAASLFSARMAKSRDQGDITFKCEGKDIKAHSFILKERYDRLHVF